VAAGGAVNRLRCRFETPPLPNLTPPLWSAKGLSCVAEGLPISCTCLSGARALSSVTVPLSTSPRAPRQWGRFGEGRLPARLRRRETPAPPGARPSPAALAHSVRDAEAEDVFVWPAFSTWFAGGRASWRSRGFVQCAPDRLRWRPGTRTRACAAHRLEHLLQHPVFDERASPCAHGRSAGVGPAQRRARVVDFVEVGRPPVRPSPPR